MTEKRKNYEFQNEGYRNFRFIEFGAKNSVVGDILHEREIHKYLGLVYDSKYWENIEKSAKTK